MDGINRDPNDPNKGLNVRKFTVAVVTAVAVIFILAFIVLNSDTNLLHGIARPKPTTAASPQ